MYIRKTIVITLVVALALCAIRIAAQNASAFRALAEFRQDNDGWWNAAVDTAFVELDESGKILASTLRPFQLHIDSPAYQRLLKEGLSYTHEMLMVPG